MSIQDKFFIKIMNYKAAGGDVLIDPESISIIRDDKIILTNGIEIPLNEDFTKEMVVNLIDHAKEKHLMYMAESEIRKLSARAYILKHMKDPDNNPNPENSSTVDG